MTVGGIQLWGQFPVEQQSQMEKGDLQKASQHQGPNEPQGHSLGYLS